MTTQSANADYGAVLEWIQSVRRKFDLDGAATDGSKYWQGYKDCLADVERRVTTPPNDGSVAPMTTDHVRARVMQAVLELDAEHVPEWASDTAKQAGKDPIGCVMCFPHDGS